MRNRDVVSAKTIVRGIRATQEFWEKCDIVAEAQGTDRNKLIVRVVNKYCDKKARDGGK